MSDNDTRDDRWFDELYRSDETSPPEVDRQIRAAARSAVRPWTRWYAVGTAASVILAAYLGFQTLETEKESVFRADAQSRLEPGIARNLVRSADLEATQPAMEIAPAAEDVQALGDAGAAESATTVEHARSSVEPQVTDGRVAERRTAERRLAERRLAERRLAERRLAERRLAERRTAERRLAERATPERGPADQEREARSLADRPRIDPAMSSPAALGATVRGRDAALTEGTAAAQPPSSRPALAKRMTNSSVEAQAGAEDAAESEPAPLIAVTASPSAPPLEAAPSSPAPPALVRTASPRETVEEVIVTGSHIKRDATEPQVADAPDEALAIAAVAEDLEAGLEKRAAAGGPARMQMLRRAVPAVALTTPIRFPVCVPDEPEVLLSLCVEVGPAQTVRVVARGTHPCPPLLPPSWPAGRPPEIIATNEDLAAVEADGDLYVCTGDEWVLEEDDP